MDDILLSIDNKPSSRSESHVTQITPTESITPTSPDTPARIIDIVPYNGIGTDENAVRIIDKRKRMMRRNAVTDFISEGTRNIKRLFPENTSPENLKWKNISPTFISNKKRHIDEPKKVVAIHAHSPREFPASPKLEYLLRHSSTKETSRPMTSVALTEVASDTSILSSYPIMALISEYIKDTPEDPEELNMDDLFEHWITGFMDTCQRQMKDIIISTNSHLRQSVDLDSTPLAARNQNISISTIPTWNQVRLLKDRDGQKYIALKKSYSLSWFILPRESPKLSQNWVCYPIDAMNTLEMELRLAEENSIQWMLLRMIILKCLSKVKKSDILPVKFDINNILLISSTCGLIVVFKESDQELDMASLKILKTEKLDDVPKQWICARTDVRKAVSKFFYRLNIISVLICSIWPLDNLAYILVKLIMESEN